MSLEGQLIDNKSLRSVTGKSADFDEIAKDCVAWVVFGSSRKMKWTSGSRLAARPSLRKPTRSARS